MPKGIWLFGEWEIKQICQKVRDCLNRIGPSSGDVAQENHTSLDLQKFYKKLLTRGR